MVHEEKGRFCEVLVSLFSPPHREIIREMLEGELLNFFKLATETWQGNDFVGNGLFLDGDPEKIFEELSSEYRRLFEDVGSETISLVESAYKPWTLDAFCPLPFAKEKGLLMGDSALHLLALYQHCGLEIVGPLRGIPDHLILELEFLSFLYQHATDQEIKQFIEDHLDWIPLLQKACEDAQAHPFYLTLVDLLRRFIHSEKERLEKEFHGEKEIYSEDR